MAGILIAYSTVDGQTLRICERLKTALEAQSHHLTLAEIDDGSAIDIRPFDKVVIGASIRYGGYRRHLHRFVSQNAPLLAVKPSAFFSVNLEARKPGRDTPETNPYVRRFLAGASWRPMRVAVFAGRLDYTRYGFWDRHMVRLIMRATGGPTEGDTEFTDWSRVESFGRLIGAM